MFSRGALLALLGGLALGTAGCTDRYGYGGVSMGYGGYADGYGYGGPYDGYGYGYGYAPGYFGWSGDYYYPGSGIYVYDRYRRPHRWNDSQRAYWQGRRGNAPGGENWHGFGGNQWRGRYQGNAGQGYRPPSPGQGQGFRPPSPGRMDGMRPSRPSGGFGQRSGGGRGSRR
jgi:hypothetical protein